MSEEKPNGLHIVNGKYLGHHISGIYKPLEKPSRAITGRREPEYVPVINQYERSD